MKGVCRGVDSPALPACMGSQLNLKAARGDLQADGSRRCREGALSPQGPFRQSPGAPVGGTDSTCCPNPLPELRAKRWVRGNRACKGAEAGESPGSENEEEVRALTCWRPRATWSLGGLSGGGQLPLLGVPGCSAECDVERVRVTRQDWIGGSCLGGAVQVREGASWA